MNTYIKIVFIVFVLLSFSCSTYSTKYLYFYNYTHSNDLWIQVSGRKKGQEKFVRLSGTLCNRNNTRPWCGTDRSEFKEWDEFLIVFSNADRTKIYKEKIVSQRKLFGKWKGNIKYGRDTWRSHLSEEDYKQMFPNKTE